MASKSFGLSLHCQRGALVPKFGCPSLHHVSLRMKSSVDPEVSSTTEKEEQIEELEARIRGKAPAKRISAKNVSKTQTEPYSSSAAWNEGELFPKGWENMSIVQKVSELYMGRRGLLFWANKVAYASIFVIIGAWIIFRFVGPNLGLYQLGGEAQHLS